MKAGFLLRQPAAGGKHAVTREDSAGVEVQQPQARPQTPQVAASTPEQVAAGLAECLQLLRGPTDERRFVGLLLVTKLLPSGDEDTIKKVHDAVGPTFLTRLLLPLRTVPPAAAAATGAAGAAGGQTPASTSPGSGTTQQEAAAAEAAQKEAATCSLGLAVLSSFARVAELAASDTVLGKLPLLLNVVRAGGISPLLATRRQQAGTGSGAAASSAPAAAPSGSVGAADAAADAAAVQDALECAVAAASSGEEGRRVAAECGALTAAAALLQRCPAGDTALLSLALQLLAAVLGDVGSRAQLLSAAGGQAATVQQLLSGLARVFALPAQQGQQAQQTQQAQQRQLLALQLEALHVLLLLLPLPAALSSCQRELSLWAARAAWPRQLRQGLALLLRGRISAVQRHSALQLAAAVLDLLGPDWLLGRDSSSSGASTSAATASTGSAKTSAAAAAADAESAQVFFQLLVEVTKVETSVLLHDALAPDVPVPLASAPAAAAADWRAPAPRRPAGNGDGEGGEEKDGSYASGSEGEGPDAVGAELAADLAGGREGAEVAADVEPLVRVLHSERDRQAMQEQLQREEAAARAAAAGEAAAGGQGQARQARPGDHMKLVDEVQIPTDMRWEGPSEQSGARAARMLPLCFGLLEGCVEALAADTQRAEGMMEEGGDLLVGSAAAAGGADQPALSDAVAQRALFSLQEAAEVVLQFIEQTVSEEEAAVEEGGEGCAAPLRKPLLLAALRVLARFCAEVPEAFAPRLRPLLPSLLSLRIGGGGRGGSGGSEEGWMGDASGAEGEGAGFESGSEVEFEAEEGPAEGVTFLLPLLLQVTDPAYSAGSSNNSSSSSSSSSERELWLDSLTQPAALQQLLLYTRQCVADCGLAVISAAAAAADDALLYACELLLNFAAPEAGADPAELGPGPSGRVDAVGQAAARCRRHRQQLVLAADMAPLLRSLLLLTAMRPVVPMPDCSADSIVRASRLLCTLAALCATLAAAVATELTSDPHSASATSLRRTEEQQAAILLMEEQEEAVVSQRRRQRRRVQGIRQDSLPPPDLPFLGPLSGRVMYSLCCQVLAAMQVASQLVLPPSAPAAAAAAAALAVMGGIVVAPAGQQQQQQQLGPEAAAGMAGARSAVAADVALQLELAAMLDVLGAESATLLRLYPPFAPICLDCPWLDALLTAVPDDSGCVSPMESGAEPAGLHQFLGAAASAATAAEAGSAW